jgi:hypothetical protein
MRARFLLAALCLVATAQADPLHPLFHDGLWRHEFSGWLFPAQLGALPRASQPYSIDGNDDAAGAIYGAAPGPSLVVDVFGSQSADPRAGLAGSRAAVAGSHPQLQPSPARPFAVPGFAGLAGERIEFQPEGGQAAAPPRLYFLRGKDWVVSILATGFDDGAAADALVRGLPWASLGSPERLH